MKKREMKKLFLSLMVMTAVFMMLGSVSAAHTSSVEIVADGWLEENTETDFVVSVTNTDGPHSIRKVIVYPPEEYSSFTCVAGPTGWSVATGSESCTYSTLNFTKFIESGNSGEFTLTATTSSDVEDTWLVTTIDDTGYPYNNNPAPTGWTIQDAIDAAEPGATIYVPAGTYTLEPNSEGIGIVINKSDLTLKAVDATEETIIDFSSCGIAIRIINVDNVAVEGFTMEGDDSGHQAFQVLGLESNPVSNIKILNNIITGTTESAINLYGAWGPVTEITVSGNTIDNCQYGIMAGVDVSNLMIANNIITNSIQNAPNWGAIAFFGKILGTTITENEISSNENLNGIYFGSGTYETIVVEKNIISNNFGGVLIESGADFTNITINYNNIEGSTSYGVKNSNADKEVNAENNFWGVTTYNEISDLVSENVDFDPWWYCSWDCPDETAPTITFHNVPYFSNTTIITINATIEDDRDVEKWEIDFGDGNVTKANVTGDHNTSVSVLMEHTFPDGAGASYTVRLTAYDKAGLSSYKDTTITIDNRSYDWVIPLYEGWNLISFPMIPTDEEGNIDTSLDNVLASIAGHIPYEGASSYQIFQYSAYESKWYKARPYASDPGFTGTLTNIIPGYAYWVKVNQDTVLKGYGTLDIDGPEQIPPSVNLGRSWNLIGKFGDNTILKNQSRNNLVLDLGGYLGSLADYPLMNNGVFLANDDPFNPFEGYWALMPGNWEIPITYTISEADYA
ncbi:hypothetical protein DRN69_01655 [Candidatus Pacearchaeota archaeon]|nr:MAG: hypothetical protein DRN69_01655 [Candidatus Pacearchaeota archaeon]